MPLSFVTGPPMAADHAPNRAYPIRIATGDLNNDGYPDIVVVHNFATAGLYLNLGAGSFAAEYVFSEDWWRIDEGIGATSIALGDLDLDGNLDLVIPIYGNHFSEHMVQLYRGNGDGTFELWPVDGYNASTDFEGHDGIDDGIILTRFAANPMFPLIADFNGDGLPDVATGSNNGNHSVDVLLQSGDGEFSVSDSDQVFRNPQFLALGDFNEDGALDVAAGRLSNSGVVILLNNADGSGTLDVAGGYLSAPHQYLVTADFDGDGHQDIAARGSQDRNLYILYGDGTGAFPTTELLTTSGVDGYLAATDLDNDGDIDLIVASRSASAVDLFLNDGSGGFGAPESIALDAAPWGVAVDDFDLNGWIDIAVSRDDDTVQILWNQGSLSVPSGSFSLAENSPSDTALGTVDATGDDTLTFAIAAGNDDIDGDGNHAFAIDNAGVITVNDGDDLDFEAISGFDLEVTITDASGSASAAVTVDLVNVAEAGNDRPEAQDASFTVSENTSAGSGVGTVTATDLDPGDTLGYAIIAGNIDPDGDGNAAFGIDAATGDITVNDSGDLDRETTSSCTLTVVAADPGGLSDAAAITIDIADVFELEGTSGDDILTGTAGSDLLEGLAGDDWLSGGLGDDRLVGGQGIDCVRELGDVDLHLSDDLLTGLGTDTLVSIERAIFVGGSGNNILDASEFTRGQVVLDGGAGDDTLIGSASRNVLLGGEGNDNVRGGNGVDCISAVGDVDFALTADQLIGLGTDTFSGIERAWLTGGFGDNQLDASAFTGMRVTLVGRAGNDTLTGGGAQDRIHARGNVDFVLTDTQLSGLGTDALVGMDVAELFGGNANNRIDATAFGGTLVILEGLGGDDTLIGRAEGIDRVRGRGDVDFILTDSQLTGLGTDSLANIEQAVLIGGPGDNLLDASAFTGGNVTLEGGAGNDTLIGGGARDRVRASGDVDFVLTDTQLSGLGTDALVGMDVAELIGGSGNNRIDATAFGGTLVILEGLGGDDTLIGRADGIDVVRGCGDVDFTLTDGQLNGLGTDSLINIEQAVLIGGPGDNLLDASSFTGTLVSFQGWGGNNVLIGRAEGIDVVLARGDFDYELTDSQLSGSGTDSLVDIDQATLIGDSGSNVFDASAFTVGTVRIIAGGGDDTLLGGTDGDRLSGGFGDDLLVGGLGRDDLTGGQGADTFRFRTIAESVLGDLIRDFDLDEGDKIDLSAIDADLTAAGDQAFASFSQGAVFSGAFAGAGALFFEQSTHTLYGNVDADGAADFFVHLIGVDNLTDAFLF